MVGPCGGHARKDGRTGFSRAAPATLQCLRWPYWVLKRSACCASTFKMVGEVLAAAGSKSFMALVSRVTQETTCLEKSIAGSGTRAEPLQAAAQSVATGISTFFFPSNAFMASARSFNMFESMLQWD